MQCVSQLGHPPRGLRWSEDGRMLRFSWAKADGSAEAPYKEYTVQRDGTMLKQGVPTTFTERNTPGRPQAKPTKEAYISEGEIFIRDLETKATRRITSSKESKEDPQLVLNDEAVLYTSAGNMFRASVADGKSTQLTKLVSVPYPASDKTSVAALAKAQSELFKDFPRVGGTRTNPSGRVGGGFGPFFTVSPGRTHISTVIAQIPPSGRAAEVPNYVTRTGFTEMLSTYSKVGEPQSRSKLVVVDIKSGVSIEISPLRPGRIGGLSWSPDGKHAYAVASTEDNKDSWIFGFDPSTNKVSILWNEHDDAWIGGPSRGTVGWLPDSSAVYFTSERSGYSHLMLASADGTSIKALTEGKFEVDGVRMETERNRFVYVSSEGSPSKRHIDFVTFDGKSRAKLADYSADEDASFAVSPDGKEVAVVRSTSNRPPELFVNGVQVTTTPTREWLAGPWIDPPIVTVPARDGLGVPARLYKPKGWRRGGPAVIFIHGAGYLQNVYDGWSHYFREYMFHHILMERGYAVLDIDYRGSAGYGKAWRTGIYRHMGGKDLDDAVDGAKYLVKELGVDSKRIGIYGGSYGGFLTLMAMFTTPDVFAAGAALRPVTDWAHYNHGYTAPILNLPQNDPEAYRQSSPIYHAEGLKGALLICHGMVDTNVHFQDTVRLIERLIELGKTNWSVAPYPIEDHAFRRAESWTDEYRRILELFERSIGRRQG